MSTIEDEMSNIAEDKISKINIETKEDLIKCYNILMKYNTKYSSFCSAVKTHSIEKIYWNADYIIANLAWIWVLPIIIEFPYENDKLINMLNYLLKLIIKNKLDSKCKREFIFILLLFGADSAYLESADIVDLLNFGADFKLFGTLGLKINNYRQQTLDKMKNCFLEIPKDVCDIIYSFVEFELPQQNKYCVMM